MTPASGGCRDGEAYYALGLRANTTTDMAARGDPPARPRPGRARSRPSSIRCCGPQGYTQGTVGARINALNVDPRYLYPNTDEGADGLLA